jgi:hypothetical protein
VSEGQGPPLHEICSCFVDSISAGEKKMPSRGHGTASLVDVQQRLNCALPSFFFEASRTFVCEVFTACPRTIN